MQKRELIYDQRGELVVSQGQRDSGREGDAAIRRAAVCSGSSRGPRGSLRRSRTETSESRPEKDQRGLVRRSSVIRVNQIGDGR